MKAIIFSSKTAAEAAVKKCTKDIVEDAPVQVGEAYEALSEVPVRPYTYFIKHPNRSDYAVVADPKVEDCLGKTAVELTEDWFTRLEEKKEG